jgi:uncharacterized membrane protein (UPF0127 family)
MPTFLAPLLREPAGSLALRNARTGVVVARRLETAFDSRARNRGLLGRTGLEPDQALVIAPCNSVHTFFMKFTIDVVFVTRDGTVRRISAGLRPWRIAASPTSFAVIETGAGVIARAGLACGDALVIDTA